MVRKDRAKAVCQFLPDGRVKEWVGSLQRIDNTFGDEASVSIKLADKLFVQTESETEISPSNPLFYRLAKFEKGTRVRISGKLLKRNSDEDCFREMSLTEDGSMNEPEYFFQFDDISIFYADPAEKDKDDEENERLARNSR